MQWPFTFNYTGIFIKLIIVIILYRDMNNATKSKTNSLQRRSSAQYDDKHSAKTVSAPGAPLIVNSLMSTSDKHLSYVGSNPDIHTVKLARASKSFHVIIIGGSFAGIRCAQDLERIMPPTMVTITVIDRRDQYFYNLGALRALTKPEMIEHIWLPYDNIFQHPHNKVIVGDVTSVYPNAAILKDGRKLDFDSLLVATGSVYPQPCKADTTSSAEGKAELYTYSKLIKTADSILIIGGGPTGVGLAAEIATRHPKKNVLIVHSGDRLLSTSSNSKSMSRKAYKKLKSMGVKVFLNEKVIIPDNEPLTYRIECRWLKTTRGRMLFSNLQFLCNGITFHTSLMDTLDPASRDRYIDSKTNQIKVLPTMQINHPELPWIFSAGDVCNTDGEKQAYRADSQGNHVAKCMARMAQSWARGDGQWFDVHLKQWHDPAQFMSVAMGPTGGVTDTPWIVLGDTPTRIMKSKELFLARRYREFNLEFPGIPNGPPTGDDSVGASTISVDTQTKIRQQASIQHMESPSSGVSTYLTADDHVHSNKIANAAMAVADRLDERFDSDRISLSKPAPSSPSQRPREVTPVSSSHGRGRRNGRPQNIIYYKNARPYEQSASDSESSFSDSGSCISDDSDYDNYLYMEELSKHHQRHYSPSHASYSSRSHGSRHRVDSIDCCSCHSHHSHSHHRNNHHHHRHHRHHNSRRHHHHCHCEYEYQHHHRRHKSGGSREHSESASSTSASVVSKDSSHTSVLPSNGPVLPRYHKKGSSNTLPAISITELPSPIPNGLNQAMIEMKI